MAEGGKFTAWINPLAFLEVDEPWASLEKTPPTAETMIELNVAVLNE